MSLFTPAMSPISRRDFIVFSLRAFLSAAAASIIMPVKKIFASPSLDVRYIRQIVCGENETRRTVMWHSAREAELLRLDWRELGSDDIHRVAATSDYFVDDGEQMFIHSSYIKGLSPKKNYEYRISSGGRFTPWMPLFSDRVKNLKAVILSDSQSLPGYAAWRKTILDASKRLPGADLLIAIGDLVDCGENMSDWRDWMSGLDGIAEHLALAPVMGNHECYDRSWGCRVPYAYLNFFDVPGNKSAKFPRYYYSFDYGPIHFAAINNNYTEINPTKAGLFDEQNEWLTNDMKSTNKKWRVILMHKDIVNYDIHPPKIESVSKKLMALFDRLQIDAVITGHVHAYRRRAKMKNMKEDTGGTLYICDGYAGDQYYPDIPRHPWDKVTAPQPEAPCYTSLEATNDKLIFKTYLVGGKKIDEVTLK